MLTQWKILAGVVWSDRRLSWDVATGDESTVSVHNGFFLYCTAVNMAETT
jgi:hypothetical protein